MADDQETRDRASDDPPMEPAPGPSRGQPAEPSWRDRLRRRLPFVRPILPRGQVAVVRLYGPIGGAGRTAEWIELIQRLRESRRVPAVVVDIDSPGGSATASDDMFLALERLAAKKPLVATIRGVGASGSYLAAMAAHRVVANPNAVIGSIGVIAVGPRLPRLLDRLGISVSVTKAGRLKGMGAPWSEDTEEERAKEQELIDAFYAGFVSRVARGRKLSEERTRELATGEVWLGQRALELGLVDEIGDLERGIEIAAKMAGVPARGAPVRLRRPFFTRLIERFTGQAAAAIADEIEARLWDRLRT